MSKPPARPTFEVFALSFEATKEKDQPPPLFKFIPPEEGGGALKEAVRFR
jgi:hypothetical protein